MVTNIMAKLLNNRGAFDKEIIFENEIEACKEANVVVAYISDETIYFHGAINDLELVCGNDTFYIAQKGEELHTREDEGDPEEDPIIIEKLTALSVECMADDVPNSLMVIENNGSWSIKTNIPHETFDLVDSKGNIISVGIVYDADELIKIN